MNEYHIQMLKKLRTDENFAALTPRMLLFEAMRRSSVTEVSRELGKLIAEITIVQRISRDITGNKRVHDNPGTDECGG